MTQKQQRGPGSVKDNLESVLDWNAATERSSGRPGKEQQPTAKERAKDKTEAQIDEGLEETFPASDPPAHAAPIRTGPHRPAGK